MKNVWPKSFQVSLGFVYIMPKKAKIREIEQKYLTFMALEAPVNIIQILLNFTEQGQSWFKKSFSQTISQIRKPLAKFWSL